MLKLDDILKLQQIKFYYKYLHNNLPVYLQNWRIIFKYEIRNYDTRIKNEIYTYKTKHGFAKKCLRHNLPFLHNNIPTIVNEKLNTNSLHYSLNMQNLIFYKIIKIHDKAKLFRCMQHYKIQPLVTLILKSV